MRMPLHQGQTVAARRDLLDTAFGKVVDVRAIGAFPDRMTEPVRKPKPKEKDKEPKHEDDARAA